MKYGLFESQLKTIEKILSSYPQIEEAVLYGSRAIDTFKEASDVDIAIKGEGAGYQLIKNLQFYFEEDTDLPYFFDFISYKNIDNPNLKKHIDKYGIVIYQKGWQTVKLGDVSKSNQYNIDKNYPYKIIQYLDTGSITKGKISKLQVLNLNKAPSRAKRLVKNKSIIYSNIRPIQRHYGFIENPLDNLVVSTGFSVIEVNKLKTNPFFIYSILTSDDIVEALDKIAESATTAYPSLKPSDIENIEILLPPLHEQEAIAEVLSSLDDKIDLLHRQNKTLEDMAETLFRKWFIEDASPTWEIGQLGDVVEFFDNKRIPLSKMRRNEMKQGKLYPYYGAAKIMDYINKYIFDGEYILLGEDGTVRTSQGYPILQYATGKFWVNNHTHVLQAKKPYTNFLIWSYLLKKNIDKIITGAVQPKINQTNLARLNFPKFPIQLIKLFNQKIDKIFQKIKNNKIQIKTLEENRNTLLPKLINGKVRVKCPV